MLTQLIISDFAIISHLEIDFRPGLNIMSGETGAGKSIIINAVNLILGGRASADLIRSGAKEARVEALFTLPDNSLISKYLSELDVRSDGELLIKRTISREGRNRILINGSMATLQMLSGIGMMMISISGQHEHQALLKQDNHVFLLDDFGGLTAERMDLAESFNRYEAVKEKCLKMEREIKQSRERQELALFQTKEIEAAHILDREDSLLEEERKRLRHAEQLKEIIAGTYDTLYEKEDSIISELSLCVKGVEKGSEIDRRLESVGNALASAKAELEETALHLRQLRDSVVISPYRLEEVEERLHSLNSLKKKYGPSLENVMAFREELSGMIHNLDRQEKELEDIKKDLKKQEKDTVSRATALSLKRREIAEKMEKSVEGELALLEMGGTRFEVRFAPKDPEDINDPETLINSVRPEGYDRVEFMLSPNVGEELRPLSKIASGGELSRIMLALKTILARKADRKSVV